jgi:hypothetical protein
MNSERRISGAMRTSSSGRAVAPHWPSPIRESTIASRTRWPIATTAVVAALALTPGFRRAIRKNSCENI